MSNRIEVEDGRDLGAFIPANLDDYGLTPFEFRIYSRLARRAGGKGAARESVASMAAACKMCEQVVKTTLRFLCGAGMATKISRSGLPSLYRLTPANEWVHPENLDAVRIQCQHHPGRLTTQVTTSPRSSRHLGHLTTQVTTSPRSSRHLGDDVTLDLGDDVTLDLGDDVTHKGTPMKVLQEGLKKDLEKKISHLNTRSQKCSTADADEAFLERVGSLRAANLAQRPEVENLSSGEAAINALNSSQNGSEETQSSQKSSKRKKQAKSREFIYLEVFRDDEAMKQDFVALYRAHPKHTSAKQSAEAYFRLRQAGITAKEILAAHQAALGDAWRGRTVQLHPKLVDWLVDQIANRDLGIGSDRPPLPSAEQYDQVRAQYFQVCVELDAPFGDEELAQAMWRAQGADPQNLDGIVEATPYYLEKKRKREGEPICRFERYLQHRWQVVLAHKRLRTDSTVSGVAARSFIDWFNLASSVRVIQAFSSSDSGITGLPTGSIGVRLTGEDCWQDWRSIAQHYSVERLQRLKSESEQSLS